MTIVSNLVAILITTNIVHCECKCGFCDASKGIVIMEHMNRIGYDLKEVVTTNYLPIAVRWDQNSIEKYWEHPSNARVNHCYDKDGKSHWYITDEKKKED